MGVKFFFLAKRSKMSENTKQALLEALAEYDDSKEYEH